MCKEAGLTSTARKIEAIGWKDWCKLLSSNRAVGLG